MGVRAGRVYEGAHTSFFWWPSSAIIKVASPNFEMRCRVCHQSPRYLLAPTMYCARNVMTSKRHGPCPLICADWWSVSHIDKETHK
jgi:hypothetical protein